MARDKSCDFIKSILMLLVILGHSMAFWTGSWYTANNVYASESLSVTTAWLGTFHVHAFTLVSGYIWGIKICGGGYSNYCEYIRNKVRRLLIPYVFVATIWVAPISAMAFKWNAKTIVTKFIFCCNPRQLWFLWMLFGIFVLAWPLYHITKNNRIIAWIIILILYALGIIGNKIMPNYYSIWDTCQYFTCFWIGFRIREKEAANKILIYKKIPALLWIVADICLFFTYCCVEKYFNGIQRSIVVIIILYLLHIVGALMAFTLLRKIENVVKWENNWIMNELSNNSYAMYLFHEQFIYFSINLLNGKTIPWVNALVNFLFALCGSYVIARIMNRWNITRTLIGQ